MKLKGTMLLLCCTAIAFACRAQLVMKQERMLFVGSDQVEGKRIISGIYIVPLDSLHVQIKVDILDDWKIRDSLSARLTLDKRTAHEDLYFIRSNIDTVPAYRYTGKGYELLLGKGRHYEYYDDKGQRNEKISMNYAQLLLPKKRRSYVRTLPVMFEK